MKRKVNVPFCEPDDNALRALAICSHTNKKRVSTYMIAMSVTQLDRIGRALRKIFENQCNGYVHPRTGHHFEEWEKRDERREELLSIRTQIIVEDRLGLKYRIQGDPRGASIVILSSKSTKNNEIEITRFG